MGEHYFSGDDFLADLQKGGVPPGVLRVKVGMVCFLMVNLSRRWTRYTKVVVTGVNGRANRVSVIPVRRLKKLRALGALHEVERFSLDLPRMRFTFRHQTVEVERVAFPLALAYCYSNNGEDAGSDAPAPGQRFWSVTTSMRHCTS